MIEMGPGTEPEPDNDRLGVIVEAIRKTYGVDAIAVAERQVEAAESETKADWVAILARLRG